MGICTLSGHIAPALELSNRQRKNERDGNGFVTTRDPAELVISPEKDVVGAFFSRRRKMLLERRNIMKLRRLGRWFLSAVKLKGHLLT